MSWSMSCAHHTATVGKRGISSSWVTRTEVPKQVDTHIPPPNLGQPPLWESLPSILQKHRRGPDETWIPGSTKARIASPKKCRTDMQDPRLKEVSMSMDHPDPGGSWHVKIIHICFGVSSSLT